METNTVVTHEELRDISVFCKDDADALFRTYLTYGRGVEAMMGTYNMLDLVPRGRDEDQLEFTMAWVRHRDRYEPVAKKPAACAGSCCAGTG